MTNGDAYNVLLDVVSSGLTKLLLVSLKEGKLLADNPSLVDVGYGQMNFSGKKGFLMVCFCIGAMCLL